MSPSELPRNGFVRMTAAEYLADPCATPSLSNSIAQLLDGKSPLHAHARHPRLGGVASVDTEATLGGSLLHALLLGQGKELAVLDVKDWRTKAAQEAKLLALAEGKVPIKRAEYEESQLVASRVLEKLESSFGIVLKGESEIVALWEETTREGELVQCRGMLDHLILGDTSATIIDLKRCRSAHPEACARTAHGYGYAIQRAAYVSAVESIRPNLAGRVDYIIPFIEVDDGVVDVVPCRLTGEFRDSGERKWRRAVEIWARCMRENRWPGYTQEIIDLAPPPWATAKDMERQIAETSQTWSKDVQF
mgnify:CR=1 FL=1